MADDTQTSPCHLIWQFLIERPDTIRENFMCVIALTVGDTTSVGPDWDIQAEAHKYLHPENSRDDARRAAVVIGLLELHFARPGMPSDEDFIQEMDQHQSEHLSAIVRRAPLIERHKQSAEREWRQLRENQLSFQALVRFELDQPLPSPW